MSVTELRPNIDHWEERVDLVDDLLRKRTTDRFHIFFELVDSRSAHQHARHTGNPQAPGQCQLRHAEPELSGPRSKGIDSREHFGLEMIGHPAVSFWVPRATLGRNLPTAVFPGERALSERAEGDLPDAERVTFR